MEEANLRSPRLINCSEIDPIHLNSWDWRSEHPWGLQPSSSKTGLSTLMQITSPMMLELRSRRVNLLLHLDSRSKKSASSPVILFSDSVIKLRSQRLAKAPGMTPAILLFQYSVIQISPLNAVEERCKCSNIVKGPIETGSGELRGSYCCWKKCEWKKN